MSLDFGLSSTISTWGNVLTDYYGTKYDKAENELSYARAINNRDYMNQYNSPEQQMQRLKNAGLNPNLMYGQGNTGNQQQAPDYNPTQMRSTPKNVQLDPLTSVQIKKELANINYIDEQTQKQRLSNKLFEETSDLKWESEVRNLDKLRYLNNKHKQEGDLMRLVLQYQRNQIKLQDFEIGLNRFNLTKSDKAWLRGSVLGANRLIDYNKSRYNEYDMPGVTGADR